MMSGGSREISKGLRVVTEQWVSEGLQKTFGTLQTDKDASRGFKGVPVPDTPWNLIGTLLKSPGFKKSSRTSIEDFPTYSRGVLLMKVPLFYKKILWSNLQKLL